MNAMVDRMLSQPNTPDSVKQGRKDLQAKLAAVVSKQTNWNLVKPKFIKIYDEAYSDQELDTMLAFYRSPTGHAVIERSGGLLAKTNEITEAQIQAAAPEGQKVIRDYMMAHQPPPAPAKK